MKDYPPYFPFRSTKAQQKYLRIYDRNAGFWPVPSECRMVETPEGETCVRISGPVNAPPLILLPGASASSNMWALNSTDLSINYRIFALDNITDMGRSISRRPFKRLDDYVGWLNHLLDKLELKGNPHLLGISYGGWLACQFALQYPGRLGKLILLAPASTVLQMRIQFLFRAIPALLPNRYFTSRFVDWLFQDASRIPEKKYFVEALIDEMYTGLQCMHRQATVPATVLTDHELQGLLTPTLFLVGDNEKIYSAQDAVSRLNQIAPRIKTGIISGAGHDLFISQTDLVDQLITEFLASD